MDNIIYMHIDPREVDGAQALDFLPTKMTVACQREGLVLKIAAAYCCPGDQFSKAKGREIATRKLSMDLDTYRERVGYYRRGKGTKPVGFHMTAKIASMTDDNWYNIAHEFVHDQKLTLLDTYCGFKQLHMHRLDASEELKCSEAVTG